MQGRSRSTGATLHSSRSARIAMLRTCCEVHCRTGKAAGSRTGGTRVYRSSDTGLPAAGEEEGEVILDTECRR